MRVPLRTIRAILLLPLLGLALAAAPPARSTAHAATITAPALHAKAYAADNKRTDVAWPGDPVLCDIVLDGDIVPGDAKAVALAFQGIVGIVSPLTEFPFFLCLRSGGGDTHEAVAIAQFLLDLDGPTIATVVEDGRTCASACAVIFLAGRAPAPRGAWPQRFVHPRGQTAGRPAPVQGEDHGAV